LPFRAAPGTIGAWPSRARGRGAAGKPYRDPDYRDAAASFIVNDRDGRITIPDEDSMRLHMLAEKRLRTLGKIRFELGQLAVGETVERRSMRPRPQDIVGGDPLAGGLAFGADIDRHAPKVAHTRDSGRCQDRGTAPSMSVPHPFLGPADPAA
jgi:hypothetical protein